MAVAGGSSSSTRTTPPAADREVAQGRRAFAGGVVDYHRQRKHRPLYNAWLESLDYERHRICLNHAQIQTREDGSFEVCVAPRDPGRPNWLDTAGHSAGYLVARSLLPEGDLPPLEIEVLYEKELRARSG